VYSFTGTSHLLHAGFLLGRFSAMKMEVIRYSETSVHIQTTQRYILDDCNFNYSYENIKSYTVYFLVLYELSAYPLILVRVFYQYRTGW
jgi:hypothetical protein